MTCSADSANACPPNRRTAAPPSGRTAAGPPRPMDDDESRWIGGMVIDAAEQGRGLGRATVR
ncbi:hypothetical protein ACISRB_22405, partial [Micromonospora aurantiaca]